MNKILLDVYVCFILLFSIFTEHLKQSQECALYWNPAALLRIRHLKMTCEIIMCSLKYSSIMS